MKFTFRAEFLSGYRVVQDVNAADLREAVDEFDRRLGHCGRVVSMSVKGDETVTPDDHVFERVPHQTGCARCGYAKGHHPVTV